MRSGLDQLEKELSVLSKNAHLSLTQRQKLRDRLFKQMGQLDLVEAMQTKTETTGLVMPLNKLTNIFRPRRVMLSLPATVSLIATVFIATFTTGALADDAQPGDVLFGVKKAIETVQVALVRDPAQKAAIQLSIADERLKGLENADPTKLETALNESRRALLSAQTSVTKLQGADKPSSEELLSKLQELITNQKNIITTIVKDGTSNPILRDAVVAVRDELDKILPGNVRKPSSAVATPPISSEPVNNSFIGFLVPSHNQVAINSGGKIYILMNAPRELLDEYIALERTNVIGHLTEEGIVVSKILLDGKLIFENQDYFNNNLPRVEDGQN